jgi:hypothetical protein
MDLTELPWQKPRRMDSLIIAVAYLMKIIIKNHKRRPMLENGSINTLLRQWVHESNTKGTVWSGAKWSVQTVNTKLLEYSRSNIFKIKLNKSRILASPLPEGLAGTAWEPSKLPNYVSIVVSPTTHPTFFSLSLKNGEIPPTKGWTHIEPGTRCSSDSHQIMRRACPLYSSLPSRCSWQNALPVTWVCGDIEQKELGSDGQHWATAGSGIGADGPTFCQ